MTSEMRPIAQRRGPAISTWTRASRLILPVLLVVTLVMLVMMRMRAERFRSVGFRVTISTARVTGASVVLHVGSKKRWTLQGKTIRRDELPTLLRDEFGRRPDWVVFIDADPDVAAADVITAIDLAQSVHAKVVLVTRQNLAPR
jgi:biopolymer transport protein ExbD